MTIGEKTGEDQGKSTGVTIKGTGPDGVTIEVNYAGESKGFGRFPDASFVGTVTVVQGPAGVSRSSNQGLLTTKDGETIVYRGYGTGKSGGIKTKTIDLLTLMTASPKYAWMNDVILVREGEATPDFREFKGTVHEWK